ncbi:hypothetical protein IDH44_15620 [Paenibacillus sp. IB182496]|uniref:PLD phosphodiesterase domain-containing protein n=1 Tax=Paenibacillus sabuli TaxID=2772509 RepID=A0A927BTQ6_9BACL|nr:AAA domain-containing protein [Paenibacillus sabuli]MBD2846628.1 hypothetical protein [Paenibacillus sabuli]
MSNELNQMLNYFILYEKYARFLTNTLELKDGEHLPEAALAQPQEMQEAIRNRQVAAVLALWEQFPDIKGLLHRDTRQGWQARIADILEGKASLDSLVDELGFEYPDNRNQFTAYVREIKDQEEITICYPLFLNGQYKRNGVQTFRPVMTFRCGPAIEGLPVRSFVMNRESLEIILARGLQCEVEDARAFAGQAYSELCDKIDSLVSTSIPHMIDLLDQCIRDALPGRSFEGILRFDGYADWTLMRAVYVTQDDLQDVAEPIFRHELERLGQRLAVQPSELLRQYMLGQEQALDFASLPVAGGFHMGSYSDAYPVNEKQWRIVRALPAAGLFAVSGPPGTGKTTLVKEMIADALVRKARLILEQWDAPWTEVDKGQYRAYHQSPLKGTNPYSMVIASTNNNAVDNIGLELSREIPYLSDRLAHALERDSDSGAGAESSAEGTFCARLGKHANREAFQREKLEPLLRGLEQAVFDEGDANAACERFNTVLEHQQQLNEGVNRLWSGVRKAIEQGELEAGGDLRAGVRAAEERLAALTQAREHRMLVQAEWMLVELERADEQVALEREQEELAITIGQQEELRRQAYRDLDRYGKWKRLPNRLFNFLPGRRAFLRENPSEAYIRDTRIQPATEAMDRSQRRRLEGGERLAACRSELDAARIRIQEEEREMNALGEQTAAAQAALRELGMLRELEQRLDLELGLGGGSSARTLHQLANAPAILQLRKQLFDASLAVLEQYVVKNSAVILHNLSMVMEEQKWFKRFYSHDGVRLDQYQKAIRAVWETFFLCFPVVTTTLHSFSAQTFHPLHELFDLLFVDEAGQIMPHYLCAPLYRARRAVIVGDPEQLEPVRTFTKNLIEHSEVDEARQETTCVLRNSAQDYADRGGIYYERMGEKQKGVILNEHRRCEATIMAFSNRYVYESVLRLMRPDDQDKPFGANLVGFDIRGLKEGQAHRNTAEVAACRTIVDMLVQQFGAEIKREIGIITPFAAQAKLLRSSLPGIEAGTVHTFQGREKRIILLSTVIDGIHPRNAGLSGVVGNKPNMLNVALSRAKDQFILVGNIEAGLSSGNYLAKVVGIIRQQGAIYSLYNQAYEEERNANWRTTAYAVYQTERAPAGVDSRLQETMERLLQANVLLGPNAHYELLLQALAYSRRSLGIVSPWLNGDVLNSHFFVQLSAAQERQVEVKVQFGYNRSAYSLDQIDKIVELDNGSYRNKIHTVAAARQLHSRLGGHFVYKPPLHTKLLLLDDQILFIGSHNWLSNAGKQAREEISYRVTDKLTIAYVKKRFAL